MPRLETEVQTLAGESREAFISVLRAPHAPEGSRVYVALTDLSARRQAERQATQLGQILETSLNEVYLADCETLRFLEVNRGARENLGYTSEELSRMTPLDLATEFDAAALTAILQPLVRGEEEWVQFRSTHQRKDGTRYPAEIRLQQISGPSGPAWVAIVLDLSERERVEAELARHREQLEARVAERTAELRLSVDLMAGRELRIAELKRTLRLVRAQLADARAESGRGRAIEDEP